MKPIKYLLERVTDPVINMAETSRTRNMKKSHLFFCITCLTVQGKSINRKIHINTEKRKKK